MTSAMKMSRCPVSHSAKVSATGHGRRIAAPEQERRGAFGPKARRSRRDGVLDGPRHTEKWPGAEPGAEGRWDRFEIRAAVI